MQQPESDPAITLKIPTFRQFARRIVPQGIEGVLFPMCVFWLGLHFLGLTVAIAAGLGCSVTTITWRLVTRRQLHGLLIVGALALLARSVLGMWTGSAFLYFLQPIIGTAFIAAAFLVSVWIQRPLVQRFASDFCDIPAHLYEERLVHRYFQRCSLMWAAVSVANSGVTLWLLTSESTGTYIVAKTALTIVVNFGTVLASLVWFKRTVRRHSLDEIQPVSLQPVG